jgi:hypothetical protein
MSRKSLLIVSATAGFTALVALSWGCDNNSNQVELGADFHCVARPDDPTGYLEPICQYIATLFESYWVDPNTFTIEKIIPGNVQRVFGLPQYSTREYDFVLLSCCHTGDWAVVHVDSKTVVYFSPGDF